MTSVVALQRYLQQYDFKAVFLEELGWDKLNESARHLDVDGKVYTLTAVAQKRGVRVLRCSPNEKGQIPDASVRFKISQEVTKRSAEHLLIFVDAAEHTQAWMWMRRENGQSRPRTFTNLTDLAQRLMHLEVTLDEEMDLLQPHVAAKLKGAFDVEKVTKKFYEIFKKKHDAFTKTIDGISDDSDREWYASLMLNRLMFVYFIQRKGFLAGDVNYLRNRLEQLRTQYPPDAPSFYAFYRAFLLRLFHEGLGQRSRSAELTTLLGDVPYLNGGLFDVHDLERTYATIQIPDAAFTEIFDFFDQYQWHLDDRPTKVGNEINPDVLGYIFEKYINQKQMGAYYTKEDITEYISKNTIIPFIANQAARHHAAAFAADGAVWMHLQQNPDRYIYPAVRHGVDLELPADIAAGLHDIAARGDWNRPALAEYALPTETWREHIARRQRCTEVRETLAAGDVTTINDLITLNLDIRQFMSDVVYAADAPTLRALFGSIRHVTVLDPTCGSGAFLFAALNILEPLYGACLDQMQVLLEDLQRAPAPVGDNLGDFRDVLAEANNRQRHPNRRYFMLKSIILNNLYGVDIMDEAVEICKLRLFLKLVAQVDRDPSKQNQGLEPLPDIDFNIRAGNTLVGYATYSQVEQMLDEKMDIFNAKDTINARASATSAAYQTFREHQTRYDVDPTAIMGDKVALREHLAELNADLNRYLAQEYGVQVEKSSDFMRWKNNHKPLHWFVEFYDIIEGNGGFDVIIGNPPYIGTNKINYRFPDFFSTKFPDIYGYVCTKSLLITHSEGLIGLIVPLSIMFSMDFVELRKKIHWSGNIWYSSYDNIPASIFAGVSQRCSIFILDKDKIEKSIKTTPMYRWRSIYREFLTDTISYTDIKLGDLSIFGVPKLGNSNHEKVIGLISSQKNIKSISNNSVDIGFSQAARNFISVFMSPPPCIDEFTLDDIPPSMIGFVKTESNTFALASLAILSSDIYFWYWLMRSDGFHVTSWVVNDYIRILDRFSQKTLYYLSIIGDFIDKNRNKSLVFKKNAGKYVGNYNYRNLSYLTKRAGLLFLAELGLNKFEALDIYDYVERVLSINEFAGEKSIPEYIKVKFQPPIDEDIDSILDEIDRVLAEHYDFKDEELDFIINYDIKYRMGKDSQEE